MAKTRSRKATRSEVEPKNTLNKNRKHQFATPVAKVRDCVVRLERISDETKERLMNPKKTMVPTLDRVNVIDNNNCSSKSSMQLRTRLANPPKIDQPILPKKRMDNGTLQKRNAQKRSEDVWKSCKMQQKENIDRGLEEEISADNVVMAKLRGYSAWPGLALSDHANQKIKVKFFGVDSSQEYGYVPRKEIVHFRNSSEAIRTLLTRNIPNFAKAVQEAEIVCGIPQTHSSTKTV